MSVECRIHCTGSFDGIRKHSSPIRVFAAIGNADPGAPPHEREAPAAAMREAAPAGAAEATVAHLRNGLDLPLRALAARSGGE